MVMASAQPLHGRQSSIQKTRSAARMSGCRRPARVTSCWRRARFSRTNHRAGENPGLGRFVNGSSADGISASDTRRLAGNPAYGVTISRHSGASWLARERRQAMRRPSPRGTSLHHRSRSPAQIDLNWSYFSWAAHIASWQAWGTSA